MIMYSRYVLSNELVTAEKENISLIFILHVPFKEKYIVQGSKKFSNKLYSTNVEYLPT